MGHLALCALSHVSIYNMLFTYICTRLWVQSSTISSDHSNKWPGMQCGPQWHNNWRVLFLYFFSFSTNFYFVLFKVIAVLQWDDGEMRHPGPPSLQWNDNWQLGGNKDEGNWMKKKAQETLTMSLGPQVQFFLFLFSLLTNFQVLIVTIEWKTQEGMTMGWWGREQWQQGEQQNDGTARDDGMIKHLPLALWATACRVDLMANNEDRETWWQQDNGGWRNDKTPRRQGGNQEAKQMKKGLRDVKQCLLGHW
jgi:hypothetical protein